MKESYFSKNMNKLQKIPSENFWREATGGETLYRWLLTGAGSKVAGVFFVLKRASNPFQNRREAPDGSHYPMVERPARNLFLKIEYIIGKVSRNTLSMCCPMRLKSRRYRFYLSAGTVFIRCGKRGEIPRVDSTQHLPEDENKRPQGWKQHLQFSETETEVTYQPGEKRHSSPGAIHGPGIRLCANLPER